MHLPKLLEHFNDKIERNGLPHRLHKCSESECSTGRLHDLVRQGKLTEEDVLRVLMVSISFMHTSVMIILQAQDGTLVIDECAKVAPRVCAHGSALSDKVPHPKYPQIEYPDQCGNSPEQGARHCKKHSHEKLPARAKEATMEERSRAMVTRLRRKAP